MAAQGVGSGKAAHHAAAESVQPPTCGYSVTSTTAEGSVNLSAWIGRYVRISCETVAHYVCFAPVGTSITDYIVIASTTSTADVGLPDEVDIGSAGAVQYVVPGSNALCIFRTKSGTGRIRVRPA